MSEAWIKPSKIKKFINGQGRQISRDALFELECRLHNIVSNAVRLAPGKSRITKIEIQYAKG